jgi:hypothetical protein
MMILGPPSELQLSSPAASIRSTAAFGQAILLHVCISYLIDSSGACSTTRAASLDVERCCSLDLRAVQAGIRVEVFCRRSGVAVIKLAVTSIHMALLYRQYGHNSKPSQYRAKWLYLSFIWLKSVKLSSVCVVSDSKTVSYKQPTICFQSSVQCRSCPSTHNYLL